MSIRPGPESATAAKTVRKRPESAVSHRNIGVTILLQLGQPGTQHQTHRTPGSPGSEGREHAISMAFVRTCTPETNSRRRSGSIPIMSQILLPVRVGAAPDGSIAARPTLSSRTASLSRPGVRTAAIGGPAEASHRSTPPYDQMPLSRVRKPEFDRALAVT